MSLATTIISSQDEATWQEARRPVVTATQVRDWAPGHASQRARLLIEKLTGVREDLAGIKYIEWGKFREPFLQQWVEQKYGIRPVQNDLYICAEDPRWACTPDGYADVFGEISLSELKTSKKNLHPDTGAYLESGYDDQMQWEMLVAGASKVLFVWEQHSDEWDPWPTPLPPQAVWIRRDEKRIKILIGHAEHLLETLAMWEGALQKMLEKCVSDEERIAAETALIEQIRADYTKTDGLEDRWLFIVGGDKAPQDPLAVGVLPDELTELGRTVLQARKDEKDAKERKEKAWKEIQALTKERGDFKAQAGGVTVGWSTTKGTRPVVNLDAARKKAPRIVGSYEELIARYTVDEPYESRTMIVTEQQD